MNEYGEFRVGEIVRLASGGPPMTVRRDGMNVECDWFNGNEPMSKAFASGELITVAESKAAVWKVEVDAAGFLKGGALMKPESL